MVQQQRKLKGNYQLDDVDLRVLRVYLKDASLSYKQLGEISGLPPSTIFDRLKRLRKIGIIRIIVPMLNMEELGLGTTAWILAKTGTKPDCCEVADEVAKLPDVLEVHEIAGAYDLLIKVKARDNLDYHNISDRITKLQGIRNTFSILSLRTVKEDIRPNI